MQRDLDQSGRVEPGPKLFVDPELAPSERVERIRQLNDALRSTGEGGVVVVTAGLAALRPHAFSAVIAAVARFDAFTPDNVPYGEHDCGVLLVGRHRIIWKIDYYDLALAAHSEDAADPTVTRRVLTIMLAGEY